MRRKQAENTLTIARFTWLNRTLIDTFSFDKLITFAKKAAKSAYFIKKAWFLTVLLFNSLPRGFIATLLSNIGCLSDFSRRYARAFYVHSRLAAISLTTRQKSHEDFS